MTPFKNLVTPEQYANAQKHWTKLIAGDISGGFDMESYMEAGAYKNPHVCGTAGCSLGYAIETLGRNINEFRDYLGQFEHDKAAIQLFGLDFWGNGISEDSWDWCFDPYWYRVDNSPKGAGIRMRILFEQGLPEDWRGQKNGIIPLMYAHEL